MKDYKHYSSILTTRNGVEYPDFALGTYLRTENELLDLLNQYPYDKLMLDTAYRYNNEQEVASAIAKSCYPKSQICIIGKINTSQQESGRSIEEEFSDTLQRLCIDRIDIYLIHSSRSPHYCSTWEELIKLQNKGLIETIGVSNFDIPEIEKIYTSSGIYPEVNQIVIPLDDDTNHTKKLIDYCHEKRILIQVAMPFGGRLVSSRLSCDQRKSILQRLQKQELTYIFGTRSIQHLCQNIAWINSGR